MKRALDALRIAVAGLLALGAHSARAATLTVNPAVQRTLPANFHGVNYVGFWDTAQGSSKSQQALARLGMKVIRFPGGDPGDYYDWACPFWDATGCPSTPDGSSWSVTSTDALWAWAEPLSGQLLLGTMAKNKGPLPNAPGLSYAPDAPQSAAAWAQHVKDHGIDAAFEIGNEEDRCGGSPAWSPWCLNSQMDAAYQGYIDVFKAQAQAIHAVQSDRKVFGPVGTNEYQWANRQGLQMFLTQVGNKQGTGDVDGIALHFYKGSSWADTAGVAQYWISGSGSWAGPAAYIRSMIAQYDTRALPIYISEWHLGPSTGSFTASMQNALVTADMVGAFAVTGVSAHQYFDLHYAGGGTNAYGFLYGAGDTRGVDAPTPTFYAFTLWSQMGSDVHAVTSDVDAASVLSAYAGSRSDGSLQVMAINKTGSSQSITVALPAAPASGAAQVWTLAPTGDRTSLDATLNGVAMPDPTLAPPAPATVAVSSAAPTFTLGAYSIALYDFGGGAASVDAGTPDAGAQDAGVQDAGATDAGAHDAGSSDAGAHDAGAPDAGALDAGAPDAGSADAGGGGGSLDGGAGDAGSLDAGALDAGASDAGLPDAGAHDAGPADAGGQDAGAVQTAAAPSGCAEAQSAWMGALALLALLRRRRAR